MLTPSVITNGMPNENETLNSKKAEGSIQIDSVKGNDETLINIFMFFTGLSIGAVILMGWFFLHKKRNSYRKKG